MRLVFWLSLLVIVYAYVGYALLLSVYARVRRFRPFLRGIATPAVSIVMAARNEATNLAAKLANLEALRYPAERLQIVVVSDGSTDRTADLLREQSALPGSRVTAVLLPKSGGKALALNAGVARATGEILVFLDARQTVDADAVAELAGCFADPAIGAVSGELHLETADGRPSADALGIYWAIEKRVRKLESLTGSVVGVTGAIYAIRRELFVPLPAGTLLDDVYVPMQIARAGKRVVFHPGAIARDRIFEQKGKEFGRKVRTLTGNYQLLQLAPWMLTPANPLLGRLISHKLLRLAVPLMLGLLFVAAAMTPGKLYGAALLLQVLLYLLALVGWLAPPARRWKPVSIVYTFAMLNVAAAVAFYNFVSRQARWA